MFASALGAFIVVALLLLPYFPNAGDAPAAGADPPVDPPWSPGISPAEVEALRAQAARAEAALAEAERRRRELSGSRAPLDAATSSVRTLSPVHLVIALDTTATMTGEVASLREEIAGLSALLADLTDDAAVGIIDLKDGCGGTPALRIAPLQRIDQRSVRRLTAFTRSTRPGSPPCNTTSDEDFAEALRAAVGADWRPDSELRSIVLISDNPAHAHLRARPLPARLRHPAHRLGRARRHEHPRRPGLPRYRGVHAARRRSGRPAVRPRRREGVAVGDESCALCSTAEAPRHTWHRPARSLSRLARHPPRFRPPPPPPPMTARRSLGNAPHHNVGLASRQGRLTPSNNDVVQLAFFADWTLGAILCYHC